MTPRPPKGDATASIPANRVVPRLLTAGYTLLLTLASLLPGSQLPTIPDWSTLFSPDKVAHFGAYALFALLLSASFPERGKFLNTVKAVLFAFSFGVLMEILQAVTKTGRSFDFVDMIANLIGALIGGLLITLFYHLRKKFAPIPGQANE